MAEKSSRHDRVYVPTNVRGYAENRFTRGPVFIGQIPELGEAGEGMSSTGSPVPEYTRNLAEHFRGPENQQVRDFIATGIPWDRGAMYVNPTENPEEKRRLFRHEGIHNYLDQRLSYLDEPATSSSERPKSGNDYVYGQMREKHPAVSAALERPTDLLEYGIAPSSGMQHIEAPAYMGASWPVDLSEVTPEQREAYINDFSYGLDRVSPGAGAGFKRMVFPSASVAKPPSRSKPPRFVPFYGEE